jgi:hypothetical protein
MTGNRRLWKVAVGNLGFGIVAAILAPIRLNVFFGLAAIFPPSHLDRILVVPFLASVLCQAVLLSLWGATSGVSLWARMTGLVAGAVYLEALFHGDLRQELFGISTISIAVTTAIGFCGRALGVRVVRQDDPGRPSQAESEGLRFSIRGLMIFTAAVALLSAGARTLQDSPKHMILLTAIWAMCFVAVGLASLWATLGNVRPRGRVLVVLVLSPVLGAFFAFAADAQGAGWAYIILTMLLYAALLLGSLLVARSCGYRLVGRRMSYR